MDWKAIRKNAKKNVKHHYWRFVFVCILAAVIGTNHTGMLQFLKISKNHVVESLEEGGRLQITRVGDTVFTLQDVMESYMERGMVETKEAAEDNAEAIQNKNVQFLGLQIGHSRGVLSMIVNDMSSGLLLTTFLAAINSVVKSKQAMVMIMVVMSWVVQLFYWTFIINGYDITMRRIILEGRIYDKIPIGRFGYILRPNRWGPIAWTMFLRLLMTLLWVPTIVGAVIMRLAYIQVPYILAENPKINGKKALQLSREMMRGHKWECFLLHMSMLGWQLLSILTLGIVGMFFTAPYSDCVYAEYYAYVRKDAVEKNLLGFRELQDQYLFELASERLIRKTYRDVLNQIKEEKKIHVEKRPGFAGFLADNFSIVKTIDSSEQQYHEDTCLQIAIQGSQAVLDNQTYPLRLSPLYQEKTRKHFMDMYYIRHYSIPSLVLMFFTLCGLGWLWEVSLHMLNTGEFVNRGTLFGPWLPIYGSGALMILLLLNRFRKNPMLLFGLAVVLCGFVEYMTSVVLERMHGGTKWWDYSGYFLNLNGRICAEGLLVFGICGLATVYIIAPFLDMVFLKLKRKVLLALCIALTTVFLIDCGYSLVNPNVGEGVTSKVQVEESTP